MKINVGVVDDDAFVRESLKIILESDSEINVLGLFKNGQELLEFLEERFLDIILIDVRMPILNGVDTIKEAKLRGCKSKFIVLTTFDEDEYIEKALNNGASGYILKNNSSDKIIDTIKMVYKGNSVIQEEIYERFKKITSKDNEGKIDKKLFTERELQILEGVAKGLNNKEISKALYLTEGTVKNYITSILNKTGLKHRTQIAVYYYTGEII